MARIVDNNTLGSIVVQDLRKGVAIELRATVCAVRLERRDVFGRYVVSGYGASTKAKSGRASFTSWVLTPPDPGKPRPLPVFSPATAALTEAADVDPNAPSAGASSRARTTTGPRNPSTTGRGSNAKATRVIDYRPVYDRGWGADERLLGRASVHDTAPAIPKGHSVIITGATFEDEEHALALPAQVPLIAVNREGDPALSSLVYDVAADGSLDRDRRAPLHSALNVVVLGPQCAGEASSSLAWQIGESGVDGIAGFGVVVERLAGQAGPQSSTTTTTGRRSGSTTRKPDRFVVAYAGRGRSGPLDATRYRAAHVLGKDDLGNDIVPLGLATESLWRDGQHDAPLDFEQIPYGTPKSWQFSALTHIRHDERSDHPFVCGRGPGRWKLETEIPVAKLEDPPLPPLETVPRVSVVSGDDGSRQRAESASFVQSTRIASALTFRPYATKPGQARVFGGEPVSEAMRKTIADVPDVATIIPIGRGDGTWKGFRRINDQRSRGQPNRGAGGLLIAPARYGRPEELEAVLDGRYDPDQGAQTPETTARVFLPGGLASLDFAHPTGGRSSGGVQSTLSRAGVRVRQAQAGLEFLGLDSSGVVIAHQRVLVRDEGGLDVEGNSGPRVNILAAQATPAEFRGQASRGDIDSPSASQAGDTVMALRGDRYRGSVFEEAGAVRVVVESTGAQSGQVHIDTWRSGAKVSHIFSNGGLDLKGQTFNLRNNAGTTLLALNATGMTGNRAQAFQDATGTIALLEANQEFSGTFRHTGSQLAFFNASLAGQASAYTPTNVTAVRSFDADSTTLAELADVVGTLIADLQGYGLLG